MLQAERVNNLYVYNHENNSSAVYLLSEDCSLVAKWHNRFGHLNMQNLKQINDSELVRGMKVKICQQK